MSPEEFNMLSENVEEVDFLDPILVVPLPKEKGGIQKYRIVDGEHRFQQQRLSDIKEVLCIVADPKRFDEKVQMQQTVRMNKIRGSMNIKKFATLSNLLMERHEVPYEELAHQFGFTDENEFELLMDAARDTLPNDDVKKAFDKARGDIRTVDDLAMVLNRLFTKYGDSLPANFMILDFGGKEHIWVRMPTREFRRITDRARTCLVEGYTFDSVLCRMLTITDIEEFVNKHRDFLEKKKEEAGGLEELP